MTKETPPGSNSWNPIAPDPGTFTKLCSNIGANGIQVEQVDLLLDRENLYSMRPVHGLMILAKHKPEPISYTMNETTINNSVYFSNQIVHDAYAMHALLNILLNCATIDVGKELNNFKQFTHDFTPALKGLTLTNSHVFRQAYNNLSSSHRMNQEGDKDIYHPISYIKSGGHLWELDGLKRGPTKLGICDENNWLDIVHVEMTKKMEMHNKQRIPATVWAIIEDRRLVYQRRLIGKNYIKREIECKLDYYQPEWRATMDINQWEEEYRYAMNNERNKRGQILFTRLVQSYCESFDQLPPDEQIGVKSILKEYTKQEDIMDAWLQTQDDSLRLYECLGLEDEKQEMYEKNHIRRQHDYMPFIHSYIQALFEEGHLQHLVSN
ncbi:uncharacterized protein EV154DRAFT_490660 [Mucor mucedo]|uniref:uncharacterized protein n=1 Tax=Mucor mucedo TaxID=29922 RepID=UPI00221FC4D9|nr:uncharacterized protein EV154DRAFT_490660 [Mucor mucedo]KAI7897158.1 hypothetical protein EV154DRAFT_490660 [Mucor mucedo]